MLNYKEARESPCYNCKEPNCCREVELLQIQVHTLMDLDQIKFYLNFNNIAVLLNKKGIWKIFLRSKCQYLSDENLCSVFNKPERPHLCSTYNGYDCFYKKISPNNTHVINTDHLWINQERLACLSRLLTFDDHRVITSWPEISVLFHELETIDYEHKNYKPAPSNPIMEEWKASTLKGISPSPSNLPRQSYNGMINPCNGCKAYCCTYLVIPAKAPLNFETLDFYRYCSGFPDIEIGITNNRWMFVVKTTCQHLTNDFKCGIFGSPERPLTCEYYDEHKCSYRIEHGTTRPPGFMKVGYQELTWILDSIRLDDRGNATQLHSVDQLRSMIEIRWKESSKKDRSF